MHAFAAALFVIFFNYLRLRRSALSLSLSPLSSFFLACSFALFFFPFLNIARIGIREDIFDVVLLGALYRALSLLFSFFHSSVLFVCGHCVCFVARKYREGLHSLLLHCVEQRYFILLLGRWIRHFSIEFWQKEFGHWKENGKSQLDVQKIANRCCLF